MSSKNIYANTIAEYEAKGLLSQEQLRRIAAAGFEGAIKALLAYGFFGDLNTADIADKDFEKSILEQVRGLIKFVGDNSPSSDLTKILLNRYYYSDARALYKARRLGIKADGLLILDDGEMQEVFKNQEYSALPAVLQEAVFVLNAVERPTAKQIDLVFTQAMYSDNIKSGAKLGAEFARFCRVEIDIANILTFYRAVKNGYDDNSLSDELFDGGDIPVKPLESFVYEDTVYESAAALLNAGDYSGFLKSADELLQGVLQSGKSGFFGFAPFVKYFFAKTSELSTVRYILICLKNNITVDLEKRGVTNEL